MTNQAPMTGGRIVPITCLACNATMNPHAEKAVVPADAAEAARVDRILGGLIEEVHQCPVCGGLTSRRVSP